MAISTPPYGPIPKVQLLVEGRPTTFLVDTGAARSVLKQDEVPDASFLSDIEVTCVGVDGLPRKSRLTRPLHVGPAPDILASFVVSSTCPLNLLGTDLLARVRASITFTEDGNITLSSTLPLHLDETLALCSLPLLLNTPPDAARVHQIPLEVINRIPEELWSTGPEDVGHLQVPPVLVQLKVGAPLPRKPQYPLSLAQSEAISKQVTALLKSGALVPCTSPCNTPLFPVKKRTPKGQPDRYRMVQDLRAVNEATVLETPIVPNPHTLLSGVPPTATIFMVIDLADAFFSVPLDVTCQYLFAFTHEGNQYTWTVMPQGAQNSPSQFSKAMTLILDTWKKEHPHVVLLQYVDDLLLCVDDLQTAQFLSENLLVYLATQGCKVSKDKVQWCQPTVVFLGHCLSHGLRHLTPKRVAAVQRISVPTGPRPLQAFLGLISYCRSWIPEASLLMQPLYDALKTDPDGTSAPVLPRVEEPYLSCPSFGHSGLPEDIQAFCVRERRACHGGTNSKSW